jgi:hypothetical protein
MFTRIIRGTKGETRPRALAEPPPLWSETRPPGKTKAIKIKRKP